MPLNREERKLLHQKSNQPTFGSGKPDKNSGNEGDIAYRKVQGSGTVQYLKQDGDWIALSSSGDKPQVRSQTTTRTIVSTSGSVSDHNALSGLSDDDHTQYVLVDGTRAFSGNWTNAGNTIADLGTVTTANITIGSGKTLDVSAGTLTLSDNQISGDKVEGGTINSITINTLGGSLNANNQSITNINVDSGDISGTDIDVTGQTLLLDDNQISGDKVEGGTIAAITISQLSGAMDANNQSMTSVNIDSGAIDGTVIGANSQAAGDFTAIGAVSAGTIVGTTIDATTDFTVGTTVITDDQIQMSPTNGVFTLSSTTNGASTISTIDSTASNGASLLLQPQGPLIVSSNSQEIKFNDGSNYVFEFDTANVKFKMADDADTGDFFEIHTDTNGATIIKTVDDDGVNADLTFDIDGNIDFKQTSGTTRYTFNLDSTPELDVTGDFTIDGSGVINIDGNTGVVLKESDTEVVKIDTDRNILFNQYSQSMLDDLYQKYGFHNKVDKYHQTSGQDDLEQNYSILSIHLESTSFNSNFGS